MEKAGKIFNPQIQPLFNLRKKQWLFKKVSALPNLFQGAGLAGAYPRSEEGQLVSINPSLKHLKVSE